MSATYRIVEVAERVELTAEGTVLFTFYTDRERREWRFEVTADQLRPLVDNLSSILERRSGADE